MSRKPVAARVLWLLRFIEQHEIPAAREVLQAVAALDRNVAARLLEVERSGTDLATNEKSIRANDRSFPALVLVEALSDAALDTSVDLVRNRVCTTEPPLRYDQVFALRRDELVDAQAL